MFEMRLEMRCANRFPIPDVASRIASHRCEMRDNGWSSRCDKDGDPCSAHMSRGVAKRGVRFCVACVVIIHGEEISYLNLVYSLYDRRRRRLLDIGLC